MVLCLFLIEMGDFGPMKRAKKPEKLPTVLSKNEVARVLAVIDDKHRLMAKLLYGCGLRLMECIRLRAKDIDFERNQITVRDGMGAKSPLDML
jgi:integrase